MYKKEKKLVSFVLPALNEEESIAFVINEIKSAIKKFSLNSEIIIADNNSHDNTSIIAKKLGALVVNVKKIGYGSALLAGFHKSKGDYIVMGDADGSYNFMDVNKILEKLDSGYDLVIGNRFGERFNKNSMPFLNRYIGNPLLSFLGKFLFKIKVNDFHCGLRGFTKKSLKILNLKTSGMEFASEMIVSAKLNNLKIGEFETMLREDLRSGKSHLQPWRDGWRHLFYLLFMSPNLIFLKYSVPLFLISLTSFIFLYFFDIHFMGVTLSNITLFYLQFPIIFSLLLILCACLSININLNKNLFNNFFIVRFIRAFEFKFGLVFSFILFIAGLLFTFDSFLFWSLNNFGSIDITYIIKNVILSSLLFLSSMVIGIFSLLIGYLRNNS